MNGETGRLVRKTMVERVAIAIYAAQRLRPVTAGAETVACAWRYEIPFVKENMLACARASIEAMRRPTLAMLNAGAKPPVPDDPNLRPGTADCDVNAILTTADRLVEGKPNRTSTRLRYEAMIDAALADEALK